jgi:hypothetical protein
MVSLRAQPAIRMAARGLLGLATSPPTSASFLRTLVLLLAGLFAGLAACTTQQPSAPKPAPEQLTAFATFLAPTSLEPYQAHGAAQVSYRGDKESGELSVQVEPGPQFRIQLRARVTGSLALDVRFDKSDLLIVDYVNSSYFLGGNTSESRLDQFSLDMTVLDFQIALTGRVPETMFRDGRGTVSGAAAAFSNGGAEYRFVLDANGLPSEWTKSEDGVVVLRVEYRSYAEYLQPVGPPIRLPERIRVYAGEPQPRLVLGLRDWRVGADPSAAPITFIPPQDVLDHFKAQ